MNIIKELFGNFLFVSSASAWFIAQFFKLFTDLYKYKKFTWDSFFASGGMPSSHSSSVCALTTACIIQFGVGSSQFAISGVLALIVMKDAAGVRLESGKQAKAINRLFKEIFTGETEHIDTDLKEIIGHTPLQVGIGAIIGVFVPILIKYYFL